MRNLLLTALLVACASASAADQAQPYVKKFDVPTPDKLPGKRAEVAMPLLVRERPAPAPAAPAAPAAVTGADASTSGMPMIPASDPTNTKTSAAPAPAPSSATAATPTGSPAAGQPVATYATMAQAAKAGVDPLNEHKSAPATSVPVTPAAPVTSAGFDLKNPGSWLAWVQSHRDQAMKTALLALGILVVGFGATRFRARRNSQE
jgi:hypothetical protein